MRTVVQVLAFNYHLNILGGRAAVTELPAGQKPDAFICIKSSAPVRVALSALSNMQTLAEGGGYLLLPTKPPIRMWDIEVHTHTHTPVMFQRAADKRRSWIQVVYAAPLCSRDSLCE